MLPGQSLPPLAHINIRVSGIIPAPAAEVWGIVRAFGSVSDWMAPIGLERITSTLLPGSVEGQLGALRRLCYGELGFVEQLDALDDDKRLMRWRVISHPLNTNPFPGSFLNCKARLRLRDVTISKVTMLELENEFDTEHMSAEVMRRELTARSEASIRGLLSLIAARPSTLAAQQQKLAASALLGSLPLPAGGILSNSGGLMSNSSGAGNVLLPAAAPAPNLAAVQAPGVFLPNGAVALQQQDQQQPQYLQVWGYDYGQVPAPAMANVPLASPLALSGGGVPAPIVHPRLSVAPNPLAQPLAPQAVLSNMPVMSQQLAAAQAIYSGGTVADTQAIASQNAAAVAAAGGGAFSAAGGMQVPTSDLNTINSYNSFTSNDSLSSVRGQAMSRALQQAQAGLLPESQVAALQALQQQHAEQLGRVSFESSSAPGRSQEPFVGNSGDSHNSISVASPPNLSPRSLDKAKQMLSGGGKPPSAPATLDGAGRLTTI